MQGRLLNLEKHTVATFWPLSRFAGALGETWRGHEINEIGI